MGLFDIFKKPKSSGLKAAPTMTGHSPFYSPFGDSIYASDIIIQAISRIASEGKKLMPRHIRVTDGKREMITNSSIAHCLRKPNAYMTTAEFLEKCFVLLNINKNLFIYHEHFYNVFGERITTGLYPLKPSFVEYRANQAGDLFIYMEFASGYNVALPLSSVTHYRKNYGVNDYFGGGISGGNDERGLLKMLKQYDKLTQGIAKAMAVSCTISGMVKINTYTRDDNQIAEEQQFAKRIQDNESGILFTDQKTEYTHFPRDIKMVDADTLKFFNEAILRNMGVSMAMLNADYSAQQKQAFYESALEADVIGLGQALTNTEFSDRAQSFGNEIILYPNKIDFMTMEQKISYMQVAVPAGAMSINQILEFGGLPPVEGGDARPRGFNSLDGSQTDQPKEKQPKEDEGGENEE